MEKWVLRVQDSLRGGPEVHLIEIDVIDDEVISVRKLEGFEEQIRKYAIDVDIEFTQLYIDGVIAELQSDEVKSFRSYRKYFCNDINFIKVG